MHLAASLACRASDGSEIAVFMSLRFPPESTSHKHKVVVKCKVRGREKAQEISMGKMGGKNWRKKKKGKSSLVLEIKISVPNSHLFSVKPCFLDLLPKDCFLM